MISPALLGAPDPQVWTVLGLLADDEGAEVSQAVVAPPPLEPSLL